MLDSSLDILPSEILRHILQFLTYYNLLSLRLINSQYIFTKSTNHHFFGEEDFKIMNESKIKLLELHKYTQILSELKRRTFGSQKEKFNFLTTQSQECNLSCFRSADFIRESISENDIFNYRKPSNNSPVVRRPNFRITFIGSRGCGKSSFIYNNLLSFPLKRNSWDACPEYQFQHMSRVDKNIELASVTLCECGQYFDMDDSIDSAFVDIDLFCVCFSVSQQARDGNEFGEFLEIEEDVLPKILHHSPQTPFLIMGCKTDLRKDNLSRIGVVSKDDGIKFAKKIGALTYLESSSFVGYNFTSILEMLVKSSLYRPRRGMVSPKEISKCSLQ